MEDWMVSLVIASIGVVSTFAVLRQKVADSIQRDIDQDEEFNTYKEKLSNSIEELQKFRNETSPAIEHYSRIEVGYGKKIDYLTQEITKLNQQITQAPTMKEVRDEFVTKEMYKQLEKHIDIKFNILEDNQNKANSMLNSLVTTLKGGCPANR